MSTRMTLGAYQAHEAVLAAEKRILMERPRARSVEGLLRLAEAHEARAQAWAQLAQSCEDDEFGNNRRAMTLAATHDQHMVRHLRKLAGQAPVMAVTS